MDEARRLNLLKLLRRLLRGPNIRNQKGQAFVEYLLVLIISLAFLRFVFFNREFGLKASLDRTMLRLGSYLELNLKTGTRPGDDGVKSLDAYAGSNRWRN